MRSISNEPKWMLPKPIHLWECKVNEETSLYECSKESIEIDTLNTNEDDKSSIEIWYPHTRSQLLWRMSWM